ncbi:hypothetical protein [Bosea vaviloviae]|uniref:hypothetical protein n=1 Tax=Bosea vaviloviae TaxID=1526658 RepID=UPI0011DF0580|nr:hypothetical protein [Bosea vaviloviae]
MTIKSVAASALVMFAMLAPVRADDSKSTSLTGTSLTGTWRGTYVCAQGRTGLTLTIDRQSGRTFSGVFHFYAVRNNGTVPDGCFTVSGQIVNAGKVDVAGSTWIKRPAGYITVDLHGQLTSDGAGFSGEVMTPGSGKLCSTFKLERVSTKSSIDESCRRDAPAVSWAF